MRVVGVVRVVVVDAVVVVVAVNGGVVDAIVVVGADGVFSVIMVGVVVDVVVLLVCSC